MSQSEILGPTGAAGGFAFYSYGTRIIINNPWTSFRWAFYTSAITGEGGAKPALAGFLKQSSISFNPEPFDIAPGSVEGVRGTVQVNNVNHAAALQAETVRIQSTESVYGG
jgi:hypothetical protein